MKTYSYFSTLDTCQLFFLNVRPAKTFVRPKISYLFFNLLPSAAYQWNFSQFDHLKSCVTPLTENDTVKSLTKRQIIWNFNLINWQLHRWKLLRHTFHKLLEPCKFIIFNIHLKEKTRILLIILCIFPGPGFR
jgi:hypothetical protein